MEKQLSPSEEKVKLDESLAVTEIGSTGLKRAGGYIQEEFLKALEGKKGVETYREMRDNDPIIGAILFAIQMMIRRVPWRVEIDEEAGPDAEEAKDFLEQQMEDMTMTWEDTISEILSMLPFGWSYHEQVFKKRNGPNDDHRLHSKFNDGRIGWSRLPIRAQETLYEWKIDQDGEILGMVQIAPPNYEIKFIPMQKALLFRTTTHKNSPEGRSILRNAYKSYYFKKHIENIEGIGIERDLAGLPVALVPPELLKKTASPEHRATLDMIKKLITNIRRDEQEGVVFPKAFNEDGQELFELKLLSSGGTRQFDTDKVLRRKAQEIASVVLADFILLGHEGVGSFSLGASKQDLFIQAIRTWVDGIASVFNRFAVLRLFSFNTFRLNSLPYLAPGEVKDRDLEALSQYVLRLAQSGLLLPDPELENTLREEANLPLRNIEEGPDEMTDFLMQNGSSNDATEAVQQSYKKGDLPLPVATDLLTKIRKCTQEDAWKLLK